MNAHYHRLDVLAEFEKLAAAIPYGFGRLLIQFTVPPIWLWRLPNGFGPHCPDATDCRLSEAVRLTRAEARARINFRLLLAPSTDVSVKLWGKLERQTKI
ncbi:MAG: hypothetical protein M3X11_23740 [Acidobacteriota bacterium]|nr:hypothetical protein [Acidobacteriota bacterium]